MLGVQNFLSINSLSDLKSQYGIKYKLSDDNKLVILNYDQVASHKKKEDNIVLECRQLVLENTSWKVVAKSFDRFFNWNESKSTDNVIKSSNNVIYQTKHDGSIIMMFYYNGWKLVTRNSFGNTIVHGTEYTWEGLFETTLNNTLDGIGVALDKTRSYIFELCTPYNQVIRLYKQNTIYLLGSISSVDFTELTDVELDTVANAISVARPETHILSSINDIFPYLNKISANDKTYEGLVIKVPTNKGKYIRCKFKTQSYLRLHHFPYKNFTIDDVIPLILNNEIEEIKSHPDFVNNQMIDMCIKLIGKYYNDANNLWQSIKDISDSKTFSLTIKDHPLNSVFFKLRTKGKSFDEIWAESSVPITKLVLKDIN